MRHPSGKWVVGHVDPDLVRHLPPASRGMARLRIEREEAKILGAAAAAMRVAERSAPMTDADRVASLEVVYNQIVHTAASIVRDLEPRHVPPEVRLGGHAEGCSLAGVVGIATASCGCARRQWDVR